MLQRLIRRLIVFEILARARGLTAGQKYSPATTGSNARSSSFDISSRTLRLLGLSNRSLSYSYTALEPFRYAKANGWKTLLVQIDPGPEEERIVAEEAARVPELAVTGNPRHLNIGTSGVRNASSPTALLLTPNGRVKGWFAEEFQPKRYQSFRWRTKRQRSAVSAAHESSAARSQGPAIVSGAFHAGAAAARAVSWSD